ncbi:hypothetical protein PPERSA_04977 [Pseudocohnilembus persalinus]|uniref:PAS domain n=1 Tax=Pseudocohnilembus persalinus TaxID=266149 RepID=A0A0V0QVI4_PSEPJ|nr:hypothetical protein PPERSA_04977 [Pseudocohnilembus persalinus]|eukprot:KRX06364.1 hypothetical protein PPERSA_04977 [Pseudocohnilembus persalinus]
MTNKNLTRSSSSTLTLILLQFKLVIGVLFGIKHFEQKKIILNFIVLTKFFLEIYDLTSSLPYGKFSKLANYYVATITNFVFCTITIFYISFDVMNYEKFGFMCLTVLPIVMKISLIIIEKKFMNIVISPLYGYTKIQQSDYVNLEKKIQLLCTNQEKIQTEYPLVKIGLLKFHKISCKDQYCICQKEKVQEAIETVNEIDQNEGTTMLVKEQQEEEFLYNIYLVSLIKSYYDSPFLRLQNENCQVFIRQINYMSEQGYNQYAARKIIQLIYEADQYKNIDRSQIVQIHTLLEIVKIRMRSVFYKSIENHQIDQTVKSGNNYLNMMQERDILRDLVTKCIAIRIESLDKMKTSFETTQRVEEINEKLNSAFEDTSLKMLRFYDAYPINENFNFVTFFFSEIMGDIQKADSLKKEHEFQKDFQSILFDSVIDIFSSNTFAITVTMGKVLSKIVYFSPNLPQMLGYTLQDFEYKKKINDLLPNMLGRKHDSFIQQFLNTEENRVINFLSESFWMEDKKGFLLRIETFIQINNIFNQDIPFTAFGRIHPSKSGYILINEKMEVEAVNKAFLEKVKHPNVQELQPGMKFDVHFIIKNFEKIVGKFEEGKEQKQEFFQSEIQFPNTKHFISQEFFYNNSKVNQAEASGTSGNGKLSKIIQSAREMSQQSKANSARSQESQKKVSKMKLMQTRGPGGINIKKYKKNLNKFISDYIIQKRVLEIPAGRFVYYILELKHVQENNLFSKSMSQASSALTNQNTNRNFSDNDFKVQQDIAQIVKEAKFKDEKDKMPSDNQLVNMLVGNQNNANNNSNNNNLVNMNDADFSSRYQEKEKQDQYQIEVVKQQDYAVNQEGNKQNLPINRNQNQNQNQIQNQHIQNSNILDTSFNDATSRLNSQPSMIQDENPISNQVNQLNQNNDQSQEPLNITGISHLNSQKQQQQNLLQNLDQSKLADESQLPLQQNESYQINQSQAPLELEDIKMRDQELESNYNNNQDNQENQNQNQKLIQENKNNNNKKNMNGKSKSKNQNNQNQKREQNSSMNQKQNTNRLKLNTDKQSKTQGLFKNQQDKDMDGNQSMSSQGKGNQFLDKFNIYSEIIKSKKKSMILNCLLVIKYMEILVLLISTLLSLILVYSDFSQIMINIDSLLLKANTVSNYGNFIAICANYQNIYKYLGPGYTYLGDRFQIYLEDEYATLKEQFVNDYNNDEQTEIFTENYLTIYDTYDLQNVREFSITLVDALNTISNHMNTILKSDNGIFDIETDYTNYDVQTLANNFNPIFDFYTDLAEERATYTQEYINQRKSNLVLLTVILNLVAVLVFSLSIILNIQFQKEITQFFLMVQSVSIKLIESEYNYYKDLQIQFTNIPDYGNQYIYDPRQIELNLINRSSSNKIETQKQKMNQTGMKRGEYCKVQKESYSILRFLIFTLVFYFLFLGYSIWNLVMNQSFFNSIKPALTYYQEYSDVQTRIPVALTIKALHYTQYSTIFDSEFLKEMDQHYVDELDKVLQFIDNSIKINSISFYNSISGDITGSLDTDLCTYQDDTYENIVECDEIYDGALKNGVLNSLSAMHQSLYDIYQLDFDMSEEDTFDKIIRLVEEVESTALVYRGIQNGIDLLNQRLIEANNDQRKNVLYLSIGFITVILIGFIIEGSGQIDRMKRRFLLAKKLVYLIPNYTVLIEDSLPKKYQALSKKLKLVS